MASFRQNIFVIIFAVTCLPNLTISYGGWIFDRTKTSCGVIYTGSNFTAANFPLKNPQVLNDMSDLIIVDPNVNGRKKEPNQNWDKRLASFMLFDGCRLKVCDGTHLDGNCAWFNKTEANLEAAWKNQISSLGCSCPIVNCEKARCDKIKLRPKDCARAFLEYECQICGGAFVSMKKNSEQAMFGGYENKIKSLVVNQGCNLTYYTGPEYEKEDEEDETVLTPGLYNKFDATLGSYTCTCDEINNIPPPPVPANPDHPKLINMPLTVEEIQRLTKKFPQGHAGLDAALTSVRNKRSPRNAYILLIGLTGSGKSSAINFLFDNSTICAVGSSTSTTASIDEYRIPIQVDELGCKNCELRVLDTPGFGDTSGLETDAKFLAGLETFLSNHEELRHRLPNIVLVVSKFTDNRFKGKSSSFVKTLRGIDLFGEKLFDSKYSNVINVLTHFMSENAKIRKNPAKKLREFREIIGDYTLFPKPIVTVVAENKPEDQDMVMVNGYYLLPNGEYYPQNLFEKIQESTERGQDPVGEAIIRTAFKYPENFNITRTVFPLKNVTFSREPYYLAELSGANFNIEMTEVSNITANVYNKEIPGHLKANHPGSLEYIQRILNLRKVFTKENIPRTTIGILKLFKHVRQNPLVQLLLLKAFDLEIPKLEIPLLTGQCYNVLKDVVLPVSPFKVTSHLDSDTGFKLPDIITSSISNEQTNVFNLFDTKKDYEKDRIQNQLKIEGSVTSGDLNLDPRPGFNTLELFDGPADSKQRRLVTSVREYRLFKLTLNDNVKFNAEFIDRVKKIPPFDPQNHTIVDDWKHFFNKYGTHVVSSAYGGGAIQTEFKVKNDKLPSEQARLAVKKSIEDFFNFLDDVYLGKGLAKSDIDTELVKYSLTFRGGDYNYAVTDFSGSTIDKTSSTLDDFRESLEYQPTMLQTSISLIPLSVFVNKLDKDLSFKVSNATATLLNARLTYTPPPPPPPPLERPEVKKHIEDLRAALQANVDRLSQEMKVSRQTFDNFTQELIRKNEQERKEMAERLKDIHRKTLQSVFYHCIFGQANLKGDKICNGEQTTCLSIFMKSVRSVNTHNTCIQFYNSQDCSGRAYRHSSNETHNNKFPFEVAEGRRFSLHNCS